MRLVPPPLAVTLLVLSLAGAACETPRPIQVAASDAQLPGLYWEASRSLAPAVLLLHAPGHSREHWLPLAHRLHQEGYAVLLLELRATGRSHRDLWIADARAGFEFLRSEKKVDAARIGLIGAGDTARAALDFAAAEALARLAVLLSPAPADRGEAGQAALRDYGFRPLLLAAGEDDPRSGVAVRRLAEAAQGKTVVELSPGTAHGTEPMTANAELTEKILAFLKAYL